MILQACNFQARLQKEYILVILFSFERVLQCFINPNDCIGFSECVIWNNSMWNIYWSIPLFLEEMVTSKNDRLFLTVE